MAGGLLTVLLLAAQPGRPERRWAMYEREMQDPADDPPDAWEETEFAFARLRYRSDRDRMGFRSRSRWGIDANKSDRQFLAGVRRLTRIHTRSVEQIIDIDSDEIFDWPWLYAVGIGDWKLNASQAARLRKYFDRGGFFVVDDFHNEREWASFMEGMHQIYPDCQAVELQDGDPILHTVFDLTERYRVPGLNVVHTDQIERGGILVPDAPGWGCDPIEEALRAHPPQVRRSHLGL